MADTEILGCRIHGLTMGEAVERIASFIKEGTPHQVITANPEIIYKAYSDPVIRDLINQAHLVTADGAGVVWAARYLNCPVPERVTGIDLMGELLQRSEKEGWRFFFLGAAPGVAKKAAEAVIKKHPLAKVVGVHHGYFNKEAEPQILEEIRQAQPHILLVALGAPKQEFWIREHLQDLRVPVAIGVGGSLDVWAGVAKRAPLWVRRANLEWLARLIREPKRYKRILSLPKFLWTVIKEK